MNPKPVSHNRALRHLRKADLVLAQVISQISLPQRKRRSNYFRALALSIISQQLSTKAASTIAGRFRKLFKNSGFPTPRQVMRMSEAKMRTAGLSYGKIRYIKDLARAIESKQLNMRRLQHMDDEQVIVALYAEAKTYFTKTS